MDPPTMLIVSGIILQLIILKYNMEQKRRDRDRRLLEMQKHMQQACKKKKSCL